MSLTSGRGPLAPDPAGRFEPPVPSPLVYVEPLLRRVRAVDVAGRTLVDSERVLLVHRPSLPPSYAFPPADVVEAPTEAEPAAPGHVRVPWDAAARWFEEDEEVFMHAKNPYHRVDCMRGHRRLRVAVAGVVLVDTDDTVGVYETALPPRLYVGREHVRMDVLVPSATTTWCSYKGTASYWTARVDGVEIADVAWSYDDPLAESFTIREMLAFDPQRADVFQDVLTAD